MPSQKAGVAIPAIEKVRTTRSIQVFCFNAEIVPSGMAMVIAMIVAMVATSSETGKRVAISWTTGLPDHIEMPRSPRARPQMKFQNCTQPGPVDADLGMAGGERLGREAGAAGAEPHQADVAWDQPHQDKHQHRRSDERRDHQQEAAHDIAMHWLGSVSVFRPVLAFYRSSQMFARSWFM